MALIIQYFQKSPLDLGVASKELIYNAYLVRSMKSLGEHGDFGDSEPLVKPEAWKTIWYFWGVIESICVAAGIDSTDVLERLKSQGKNPEKTAKAVGGNIRVSDLATLLQQNGDLAESESSGTGGDDSEEALIQQRREDISSVFGN